MIAPQIYLEVPRARVTKTLAHIKESAGDVNAASELMQELQIETFGSMERREKVEFILEQMRLLKEQEDWEKMAIVAKKINLKWLAEKDHQVRAETSVSSSAPLPCEQVVLIQLLSFVHRTSNCDTSPS